MLDFIIKEIRGSYNGFYISYYKRSTVFLTELPLTVSCCSINLSYHLIKNLAVNCCIYHWPIDSQLLYLPDLPFAVSCWISSSSSSSNVITSSFTSMFYNFHTIYMMLNYINFIIIQLAKKVKLKEFLAVVISWEDIKYFKILY